MNPPLAGKAPATPRRLTSLDAWRGWVMFLMMAEALQFCAVASAKPGNGFWKFLCHQQTHAPWKGCTLHDMIQPSFTFLVGTVLPFSIASRAARGQSRRQMTIHAFARSFILIFLGVLLRTINAGRANWTFEDTLSQIGMGYGILFLLGFCSTRVQWTALIAILVGYWAAFVLYPLPVNFNYPAAGVSGHWPQLMSGFSAHWNKNSNLAWAFDTWFLNFFPRAKTFHYNGGGYATLSFIPTLGTMILGLIAGNILRDSRPPRAKTQWFVVAGAICLGLGLAAEGLGVCPIVKRIWTPSWVLYSGGWCFFYLAGFYTVIEIWNVKKWSFPLLVIGSNSIAAYCVANTMDSIIDRLSEHYNWNLDSTASGPYTPLWHGAVALALIWLGLYLLHRKKIFLRI
jgi:predicted acyltransferase